MSKDRQEKYKSASNLRMGKVGLSPATRRLKNKNQFYIESYKNRKKQEKQEEVNMM